MQIDVRLSAEMGQEARAELRALAAAVYPSETRATLPGIDLSWAPPEYSVVVRDRGQLVAHVGFLARDVLLDGLGLRVGGIGGVMTHPDQRGRGYASAALKQALAHLAVDTLLSFALLTCPPTRVSFYRGRGWQPFSGRLLVDQPGGALVFDATAVLVLPVRRRAPYPGTLDLRGMPW